MQFLLSCVLTIKHAFFNNYFFFLRPCPHLNFCKQFFFIPLFSGLDASSPHFFYPFFCLDASSPQLLYAIFLWISSFILHPHHHTSLFLQLFLFPDHILTKILLFIPPC